MAISLYFYNDASDQDELVKQLGKFTIGKGCTYVKKLADINTEVLKELINGTIDFLPKKYGKS